MSRFFTGGSSSEDEGSGDDNNKEEEEPIKAPVKFTKTAGASSSSEEEVDVKRVVKSTRDKRYDELTETIQRIRNHMKINDWNSIHTEFEKLNKLLQKANQIIQKEGIPRFYIKALVVLEDFVKTTHENKSKVTMNATNAKSFNAMRQKLKKHNKNYEKEIEEYRKNPDTTDAVNADDDDKDKDEEDKSMDEEEEEEKKKPKAGSDDEKDEFEPEDDEQDKSSGSEDDYVQEEGEDKRKKMAS